MFILKHEHMNNHSHKDKFEVSQRRDSHVGRKNAGRTGTLPL